MDVEDTEFVVESVALAGDLSTAYDGFHSSNRNARSGMGNFCSHMVGFVLLLTVLDKYRSEGVSGISQRLEKEVRAVLSRLEACPLPVITFPYARPHIPCLADGRGSSAGFTLS
eukprot:5890201-Prymnesium_polylepis.1